jgi:hypothetical protein
MNYVREKTDTLLQILKELPNQKAPYHAGRDEGHRGVL